MNLKKQLLHRQTAPLLLITVVFSTLFSSCKMYKDVEVNKVTEVKFTGMKRDGIDMDVFLEISNPNGYKVELTDSDVVLFLEGSPVGKVTLMEPLTVPKKSVSVQPMRIHTTYSSLDALLGNALALMFKSEFSVEGRGYVTGKVLFVSRKVEVGFSEKIDRSLLGF